MTRRCQDRKLKPSTYLSDFEHTLHDKLCRMAEPATFLKEMYVETKLKSIKNTINVLAVFRL